MSRVLFLDSVAGVAGDMFAAAFVDAGLVDVDELNGLTDLLGLSGVRIHVETAVTAAVAATRLSVVSENDSWTKGIGGVHPTNDNNGHQHDVSGNTNLILEGDDRHWHVHYPQIDDLLAGSRLHENTRELARRIFATLAEAEASVHGVPVNKAAFHELGTIDSIMDVVMAAYCINRIGADHFYATPIKPGRGSIRIAHGTHAVPPPASAKLLTGMQIGTTPPQISRENVELSTPTGIAILKCLDPTFVVELPGGKMLAHGRGTGTLDLGSYPNTFQISLIEVAADDAELPYERDSVIEISCNIDDDTAEHLAWIAEKLLEMGALDVWQTPGVGKKGRSMICLTVLAANQDLGLVADWLLRNSTSFGLRHRTWSRMKLVRHFEERQTPGGSVRYKIGSTTDGEKLKEKAEFDDWKRSN